jgi:GH24 family phage-related lysozyme (muramidase)
MGSPNPSWDAEKARIERLAWWGDLAGKQGVSADGKVWHLHPVALCGFPNSGCPESCITQVYELQTTLGTYTVSKKLFDFILATESYREFPYALPDNTSGITIGYGYDLGQQTESRIRMDLENIYTENEINRFVTVRGKKGQHARDSVQGVSDISISQDDALRLAIVMKRRYAQYVVDIYPELLGTHPDCQGAILSLVINRGKALYDSDPTKDTRLEMKQIQDDLKGGHPEMIPLRLRSMERLWQTPQNRGVAIRRQKEAKYFEEAVECKCWN